MVKGLTFLLQANVAIGRPDDFFAEMLKNDEHMVKVKSRLLKQQVKIKTFEEKKLRAENKKFHKALKDFKMKNKHQQKKENVEMISKLKQRIKEKGDDMEERDFDQIMNINQGGFGKGGIKRVDGAQGKRARTMDTVRRGQQEKNRKKNQFKQGKGKGGNKGKRPNKRPGKQARH